MKRGFAGPVLDKIPVDSWIRLRKGQYFRSYKEENECSKQEFYRLHSLDNFIIQFGNYFIVRLFAFRSFSTGTEFTLTDGQGD